MATCVREPIRRPGSIQSHGVLFSAERSSWTILQASENCAGVLGRPAEELVGTPLAELIGDAAVERLSAVLAGARGAANPVTVRCDAGHFDAIVHAVDGVAVVELEPTLPSDDFTSIPEVYAAMNRLGRPSTREQLWTEAARELHRLTGFDRVMIYHFHPDDHGQVVAEERFDESMEPYLGLHYPASDIPSQARELYLTKLSRTIALTGVSPVPMVPAECPATGEPLDLTCAELRSVSLHHSQFMRNMGQAATLSFSLIVDDELVGMITCAHRTPRRLPYSLRQALEVLAGQVAILLGSLSQIARLQRANSLLTVRKALVEQFSSTGDPVRTLLEGSATMFDIVSAPSAAIQHDGHITVAGDGPDRVQVERFTHQLLADAHPLPFVTSSLPADYPELATILPAVAGALVVPVGESGDFLAWFRPEVTEAIQWLGNLSESNRDSTFSPRNSFSAWSGSMSGIAEPWGTGESAAIELGRDLESALQRRVESTLARSALYDELTGLPNRRLLMDRLEHSLAGHGRRGDMALLFIDIDSFKWFNDSLGHDGGDAVLVQVADSLRRSARAADTVARIGGDEFVVLCEDTDEREAHGVADRMLAALRQERTINDHVVSITASIGVAGARRGDAAADVIQRADAAMYRAKNGGKNQKSG